MLGSKLYVNISHAWFLNYGLYGNRPYEEDEELELSLLRPLSGVVKAWCVAAFDSPGSSAAAAAGGDGGHAPRAEPALEGATAAGGDGAGGAGAGAAGQANKQPRRGPSPFELPIDVEPDR